MRGYLALLVWLLTVVPVSAATYHVAKTGLDTVACGNADFTTTARAKLTVSAGKNCATADGDTVIIHPGTYVETVTTSFAGSPGNFITIKASDPGVIIQGNFVVIHDWISVEDLTINLQSINVQAGANNVQLLDMTVTNAPSHGIVLDGSGGAIDSILIAGCTISGSGLCGVRGSPDNNTVQKTNITIEGCLIHDNGEDGISMSNVNGLTIRDNTIYNSGEEGMDIKQASNNTLIEGNEVYNNHNAGIMINPNATSDPPPTVGGTLFQIIGNTVYGSGTIAGDSQIRVNSKAPEAGANRSLIANNVVYGSTVPTTDGISLFRAIQLDVINNTIRNVTRFGILGRCYRDGVIMNNIIDGLDRVFSAETTGLDCTGYANGLLTEDYNLLRTTGSSLIRWTTGTAYSTLPLYQAGTCTPGPCQGVHSLSVNPQFTSTTNATLLATSPAIDAGTCLAAVTTDRLGIVRPFGLSCDMGAYEFVSGVPPSPLPGITLLPAPTQVGSIRQGGALQGGTR